MITILTHLYFVHRCFVIAVINVNRILDKLQILKVGGFRIEAEGIFQL